MIGRGIPAFVVREHFQTLINKAGLGDDEDGLLPALIEAADDMSLLTIDSRDANGAPTAITWTSE